MLLLPAISLAFCAGLLVAVPLAGILLATPAVATSRLRRLRAPGLAFLLGCLVPAGAKSTPLLDLFPEGEALVRVEGLVAVGPDLPVRRTTSLVLDVDRVGGRALRGRVRVLLPEGAPSPSPGARVRATGRLLRPRTAMNPGEADPRLRAAARGISHLLPVRTAKACTVLQGAEPIRPMAIVHRARRAMDLGLARLDRRTTRDFLACLLLGRRDRVAPELTDAFRRSGTIHFLAISGLHVGILATLAWLVLRPLPLPRVLRPVLVAAAVLSYAGVTGMRPPAARAACLVCLAALATIIRRRPRPVVLLAGAALGILLFDPPAIREVGFRLSFVAVLAILGLAPRIDAGVFARARLLERFTVPRSAPLPVRWLRRYVRRSLPVSFAAWLGTAPIILVNFGTLSLLVIPANLLVFPFIFLLVPVGLLCVATGLSEPAGILVDGVSAVVRTLSDLPLAVVHPPPPPVGVILAYYVLLCLIARRPRLGHAHCGLLLLMLGALAVSGIVARRPPDEPRITVLSVGHGLATVLETPRGGVLVYDAGSIRPGVFRRVIHPWFRHRRLWRADVLVLSHDDLDHLSGAADLLRTIPVASVRPPDSLEPGHTLRVPGATVEVLWPPRGGELSDNDRSAVLRIRTEGLSVLLTGDVEEDAVRGLLASGRDLTADVLVLPHHGAPESLSAELLAAVRPKVMIASNGPGDELDPAYAGAVETSKRGAITVYPGPRVETYRDVTKSPDFDD